MKTIFAALAVIAMLACAHRVGEAPARLIETDDEAPIEEIEPGEPILAEEE
jgi:hypothetical protein